MTRHGCLLGSCAAHVLQLALQPPAVFLAAAEAAIDRRRAAEAAQAARKDPPSLRHGDVVPGDARWSKLTPAWCRLHVTPRNDDNESAPLTQL